MYFWIMKVLCFIFGADDVFLDGEAVLLWDLSPI